MSTSTLCTDQLCVLNPFTSSSEAEATSDPQILPASSATSPPDVSVTIGPADFSSTSVSWATVSIPTTSVQLSDGRYQETLYLKGTPVTTVAVQLSPSLLLIVGDQSIETGQPASTTDNIVLSLQPSETLSDNGPTITPAAILFYSVMVAKDSTPPPSSVNTTISTRIGISTNVPNPDPNPSISSGAIAGIAISAVLVIALVIGGWYFWRRKKQRAQQPTTTLTDKELARREGDGDKIVLDPHQTAPTTGQYQTQYQEMSGNGVTQELDRSHSYKYAIGGAHELKAEDRPSELPFAGVEEHGSTNNLGMVDGEGSEMAQVPQTNETATQALQVSPHVEAQRRREVEWLEAEETRMRQRREALLQRSDGKTEQ